MERWSKTWEHAMLERLAADALRPGTRFHRDLFGEVSPQWRSQLRREEVAETAVRPVEAACCA